MLGCKKQTGKVSEAVSQGDQIIDPLFCTVSWHLSMTGSATLPRGGSLCFKYTVKEKHATVSLNGTS